MSARTADSGPTRETLRSYIGAFMAGLKDTRANPDDVRAVLGEFLGLDLENAQAWMVAWRLPDTTEWVQLHHEETPARHHAWCMRGTVRPLFGGKAEEGSPDGHQP